MNYDEIPMALNPNQLVYTDGVPCVIKQGWDDALRKGIYFGKIFIQQWWAIVLWDGNEDPTTVKYSALKIIATKQNTEDN